MPFQVRSESAALFILASPDTLNAINVTVQEEAGSPDRFTVDLTNITPESVVQIVAPSPKPQHVAPFGWTEGEFAVVLRNRNETEETGDDWDWKLVYKTRAEAYAAQEFILKAIQDDDSPLTYTKPMWGIAVYEKRDGEWVSLRNEYTYLGPKPCTPVSAPEPEPPASSEVRSEDSGRILYPPFHVKVHNHLAGYNRTDVELSVEFPTLDEAVAGAKTILALYEQSKLQLSGTLFRVTIWGNSETGDEETVRFFSRPQLRSSISY
jgi:hypothetical protein